MAIDFELNGNIALIRINRPERLNAMDRAHYEALSDAWIRVRDDPAIRVAIVTGAGERSFSTGMDLKSPDTVGGTLAELWLTQRGLLLNRGLEVWKPVIAAVNGYCLAGGMTLLLATDIRVAAEHATFGLAEVKRGFVPGNGGTQRVAEQLPHTIAMELLLTGEPIDAPTAAHWGLVNKVVPAPALMETAFDYARKIAANAPLAVQAAKELAVKARHLDINDGLRMEALVNHMLLASDDAAEARAAFAEKRPAVFKGK